MPESSATSDWDTLMDSAPPSPKKVEEKRTPSTEQSETAKPEAVQGPNPSPPPSAPEQPKPAAQGSAFDDLLSGQTQEQSSSQPSGAKASLPRTENKSLENRAAGAGLTTVPTAEPVRPRVPQVPENGGFDFSEVKEQGGITITIYALKGEG